MDMKKYLTPVFFLCTLLIGTASASEYFSLNSLQKIKPNEIKYLPELMQNLEGEAESDVEACLGLGLIYELLGRDEEAKECYEVGAKKNHLESVYHLGLIHYKNRDYSESFDFIFDCAIKGHKVSQLTLADIYHYGSGLYTSDEVESYKWIIVALKDKDSVEAFLSKNFGRYLNERIYKQASIRAKEFARLYPAE